MKGYLLAVVSAVTYGFIPLFAVPLKQIGFPFDTVLFYRFLFSAALIGALLMYKKIDLKITAKEAGSLSLLGLMYAGSAEFLFLGYDYMSAGIASTILFLYPLLVALIMGIGYKEKISWLVWGAIMIGFFGVMALNVGEAGAKIQALGFLIIFLSALMYALYIVTVNKSKLKEMQGTKVSFYSMLFCSVFFFFKSLLRGNFQPIPSLEIGFNFLLFALIPTVISLITLVYAIQYVGSTTTAIMGSLEPVVAVAVSVLVFQEVFTFNLAVGIMLILLAVLITIMSDDLLKKLSYYRTSRRKHKIH